MNKKYLITFVLSFFAIVGWNVFLIQRDAKLFEAYNQSVTQVK
jgi:hypothetical protein